MRELFQTISMDEEKIWAIEQPDGVCVVAKKTTTKEVAIMSEMNRHFQDIRQFEWEDELYKVVTPKIISWDEATGILSLEFKEGENLEALLSSTDGNRMQHVYFTCKFLEWMKTTGTFWRGVAPRHIIRNSKQKEIALLDFERPATLKQGCFTDEEFYGLLRGLVHEEFSAFLFEAEQQIVFPNIWKCGILNEIVSLDTIHGKRIKLLLENFFGPLGESIRTEQLLFVYRFMSSVVSPFFVDGKAFYPLKAIDRKARGAENYIQMLLQLSRIDRSQWPTYLEYEIS